MGLEQAIKEAQKSEKSQTKEPNQEGTQDRQTETKAGDTAQPDFESGIDFSDVPEQIRTQVKEKFKGKAKLLEDGYQQKFKEVATFKKAQEELVSMGLSPQEAYDVLVKHIEQKRNPVKTTEQKKEATRTLDKLIQATENLPYEEREGQRKALEDLRQAILEETEVGELRKQISELTDLVKMLSGKHFEDRKSSVNSELDKLSEVYGKEVVDKYRDEVVNIALKFPKESVKKILFHEASDDLEKSFLAKKEDKTLTIQEKKNTVSSSGSGVSGSGQVIETKGKSFSQIIQDVKKTLR